MKNIIFSIIIPVYNSEKYIKECLESIEKQSFSNYEIICINDGSTDSSLKLLKEYEAKNNKIKIKSTNHINAGVARNEGIIEAKGEYLFFIDADDYCSRNTLAIVFREIQKKNNPDILVFKAKEKNELNKTIRKNKNSLIKTNCPENEVFTPNEINEKIFNTFNYWPWNKVFKTSFIKNNKITFQNVNRSNDVMFVSKALVKARSICIINEYLIIHRVGHGTNMQSNNADEPTAFWFAFLETKNELKKLLKEEYHAYERSYLNSTLKAFKDYLYSMSYNLEVYKYVKNFIKSNAEKEFGFLQHDKEYYYDMEIYEWYINLLSNIKKTDITSTKTKALIERIRKVFLSIQDNGIKYTINRILFHLNLKADNDPLRTSNKEVEKSI